MGVIMILDLPVCTFFSIGSSINKRYITEDLGPIPPFSILHDPRKIPWLVMIPKKDYDGIGPCIFIYTYFPYGLATSQIGKPCSGSELTKKTGSGLKSLRTWKTNIFGLFSSINHSILIFIALYFLFNVLNFVCSGKPWEKNKGT